MVDITEKLYRSICIYIYTVMIFQLTRKWVLLRSASLMGICMNLPSDINLPDVHGFLLVIWNRLPVLCFFCCLPGTSRGA